MSVRHQVCVSVWILLCLLAACGRGIEELAATPTPPTSTLVPPTATPAPTRTTPPPSPTAAPPTATVTPQPTPVQLSVADILAQLEGLPIDAFFEQSYRYLQLRDPDSLFINGLADEYGVANDRFTDMSDDYVRETQQLESGVLELLRGYDRDSLSSDQRLSFDIYASYLDDLVRGHAFTYCDYPVNPLTVWGKQNWLIDFVVSHQPIRDMQDAEDYVARLSQIDTWVEQLLDGLTFRKEAGVVPPKYVIEDSIAQVEGHHRISGPDSFHVEGIELYTSFREKLEQVEGIVAQEKQTLLETARHEVEHAFIAAFLELRDYLVTLESVAPRQSGVHQFPEGEAYYAYALRQQTTITMSPEQIQELGLAEVARLQAEIQQAAAEMGYPPDISMAELEEDLVSHGGYLEGDDLLTEFESLIAEANEASETWFDLLPTAGLLVEREPFGSGIGYYEPPPLDGSGPGVFYTNPDYAFVRHIIPTYISHETVPGHHLQGALARELDLPTSRRDLDLNGYVEGWAVYAERLAWEMGLYDGDPRGNVGRRQLELARAARMIVGTGIHAKGWTRQEAATAYEQATGRATAPFALDRYVILPGQGCGYTTGLLKILELRDRAEAALGDDFDIKAFHNVILGQGSLPLEILERVVDDWIEGELNDQA